MTSQIVWKADPVEAESLQRSNAVAGEKSYVSLNQNSICIFI